tara:strand:- start:804 stop:989 length:186 start_codon:yes stop_codon:yes gene_type:complete
MTQNEFNAIIDARIEVAKQSGFPPSQEFYQAIVNHIDQLESLRASAEAPYDNVVFPTFPAI